MTPPFEFKRWGRSYGVYLGGRCLGVIEPRYDSKGSRSVNAYRAFRILADGGFAKKPVPVLHAFISTEWHPSRKAAAAALVRELEGYRYGRGIVMLARERSA